MRLPQPLRGFAMTGGNVEVEILKVGGLAAGFLIVFLVYHNAQRRADREAMKANIDTLKTILDNNMERDTRERELLMKIINDQKERQANDFKLLQEMMEQQSIQIAQLARIEQKIDTNTNCPITRRTNEH